MTAEAFPRDAYTPLWPPPSLHRRATWHLEACEWLGIEDRLLNKEYRSLIERAIQTVKIGLNPSTTTSHIGRVDTD